MSSNEQEIKSQLVMDAHQVSVDEELVELTSDTVELITEEQPPTTELPEEDNHNESPVESLQQITATQTDLLRVKDDLLKIIDAVANNKSYVTQAANYWGSLSLVQKIAGGVIIAGPTLAAGVVLNIGALITLSGYTGITYVAGGFIFDDHHKCTSNAIERLRDGVGGLADVIEVAVAALEKLRIKFAKEIEKFKKENAKLINNVKDLGNQIISLGNEVISLTATTKRLFAFQEELEETTQTLKDSAEKQEELAEQRQIELTQIKLDCEKTQELLCEKVQELNEVKKSFQVEVEKTKVLGEVLKGTVNTMADVVLKSGDQQQQFKDKLENFLSDKEASFHLVADRICDAEKELSVVKNELVQSNDRYQELLTYHKSLLEQQEAQVSRLEQIHRVDFSDKDKAQPVLSEGLDTFGVFATNNSKAPAKIPAAIKEGATIKVQ